MTKIFIIPFLISLVTFQIKAVELEEPISVYVNDACQNELMDYCNISPQLISFLTIYAQNFEGYMQAEKKEDIKRMFYKHYSAEQCIKILFPIENREITARMKSYMLYSKERFNLYLKSNKNMSEIINELANNPTEYTTEYCNSLI